MKIVLIDHSTSPLTASDLQAMAHDYDEQLNEVAIAWDMTPPTSVDVGVAQNADDGSGEGLQSNEYEVGIWDHSDAPGAAGYHAVDPQGKPYGKIFRDACDCILNTKNGGNFAIGTVGSHECIELFIDRMASFYSLRTDGKTLDAVEGSDAVEDVTYEGGAGVALSDYLLPAAFDMGAPGPYDRQHALAHATDTTPGGYRIIMTGAPAAQGTQMKVTAIYGPKHSMAVSDFVGPKGDIHRARIRAKMHESGHATRRGVGSWMPIGSEQDDTLIEDLLKKTGVDVKPLPPYTPLNDAETASLRDRIRETLAHHEGMVKPLPSRPFHLNRESIRRQHGAAETLPATPMRQPSMTKEIPIIANKKGQINPPPVRGVRPVRGQTSVQRPLLGGGPPIRSVVSPKAPMPRVPANQAPIKPSIKVLDQVVKAERKIAFGNTGNPFVAKEVSPVSMGDLTQEIQKSEPIKGDKK
jgi:hypothetical protein